MDCKFVKTNSLKAWVLAARPKTLAGCAVPVMVGLALAYREGSQLSTLNSQLAAILCMAFAFAMQIDANFVNDYFDFRRGNDDKETRLGPERACSMGWITPGAMKWAIGITTVLSCLIGLPLAFIGGSSLITHHSSLITLVGLACVVFCFLYTTCLSYWGLGDLLVLVFFGIVPVCCTYYIQVHLVTWHVFWMSVTVGLIVDLLLIINNYRDIDNDRRAGKRTLIVFIGKNKAEWLYYLLGFWGYCVLAKGFSEWIPSLLGFLFLLLHLQAYYKMKQFTGKDLNKVLGMTARNIFVFGLLATIIILLS